MLRETQPPRTARGYDEETQMPAFRPLNHGEVELVREIMADHPTLTRQRAEELVRNFA